MRIIILGDFHLTPTQPQIADDAMEDVNRTKPDLVVPLGDFGRGGIIGSPEGLEDAWVHLRKLDAPIHPILGNHDLQQESGGTREHYSMIKALHAICGDEAGGGFMEFDNFRLMFVSTDPQPADSCWTVQECYVDDAQFNRLMTTFKERPGVPVISFTHAPPVGCALRTVPTVHVRCTNAYLDQNHNLYRWRKLYHENPEFIMWFSAHYHLGHDHHNSHTNVDGTHFFQAQIHGLQTRDTTRKSRILDIEADSITVSSLDHVTRQITEQSQWKFDGSPAQLMERKKQIIANGGLRESTFMLGSAPLPNGVHPLSDDRLLIATEDGFLWETELSTRSVLGTLHIDKPLTGVAVSKDEVWRSWENTVARVSRHDLARFIRVKEPKPSDTSGEKYELPESIIDIAESNGNIYALGTSHLWKYMPEQNAFEPISSGRRKVLAIGNETVTFTDDEIVFL